MLSVQKALVTGGAGFVGRHLVSYLVDQGVLVRVLDPAAGKCSWPKDVEIVEGSVLDASTLKNACEDVDCVFHLAALAHLWHRDTRRFSSINVEGTQAILQAVREREGVRLIVTSSETVLRGWNDATSFPISESDPSSLLSDMAGPYTRSKWRADDMVRTAAEAGMNVVSLYPTVPVGPGDYGLTAPTQMILNFIKRKNLAYYNARLNFVTIQDVARAHLLAAQQAPAGSRYIIGGQNLSMKTFLEILEQVSKVKMPTRSVPYQLAYATAVVSETISNVVTHRPPLASRESIRLVRHGSFVSIEKAKQELKYIPNPITDALGQTLDWFKKEKLI